MRIFPISCRSACGSHVSHSLTACHAVWGSHWYLPWLGLDTFWSWSLGAGSQPSSSQSGIWWRYTCVNQESKFSQTSVYNPHISLCHSAPRSTVNVLANQRAFCHCCHETMLLYNWPVWTQNGFLTRGNSQSLSATSPLCHFCSASHFFPASFAEFEWGTDSQWVKVPDVFIHVCHPC